MNFLERAVGGWLHREILARPAAHARLLDQYRAGEEWHLRRPAVVCTALLPEGKLRDDFARHQEDETRHERLLAERISALGGAPAPVSIEQDYLDQLTQALSAKGLGVGYERLAEAHPLSTEEQARLVAFYVVVEGRGVEELEVHLAACRGRDEATRELFEAILADERHHLAYSKAALDGLAGAGASALVAGHASVEAKVYQRVTGRFLLGLAERELADLPAAKRALLRGMAKAMG